VSGEEKGLWGSDHFSAHPPVPIGQIVADVNIDMIGRSKPEGDTNPADKVLTGPNAIYLVGTTEIGILDACIRSAAIPADLEVVIDLVAELGIRLIQIE
jgi:Zn-dependent M28 family amino/carboxypeptidase